jgi:hypothetical protein
MERFPPAHLTVTWRRFTHGSESLDHDLHGRDELEPVTSSQKHLVHLAKPDEYGHRGSTRGRATRCCLTAWFKHRRP